MIRDGILSRLSLPRLLLVLALSWLCIGLLPAFLSFRFFYADGAYFFIRILETGSVLFPAEGRGMAYIITQWPAVAAISAGCHDVRVLAWCFGAGFMALPICLHCISVVHLLQKGMRAQAAVFVLLVGLIALYAGLFAITDVHTPAAIFLLAMVFSATLDQLRLGRFLALAAIGLLSFCMYEFWVFYSAMLVVILLWRLLPRWASLSTVSRSAGCILVGIFSGSSAVNAWRLMHTTQVENQGSLISMLVGTTYPVYLLLIVAWFAGVCLHLLLEASPSWLNNRIRFFVSVRLRVVGLMVYLFMLAILSVVQHNTLVRYSYPFRTLNLILPLIYGAWLMAISRGDRETQVGVPVRIILVVFTCFLIVSETWMTAGWRWYQRWAGDVERIEGSIYVAQQPTEQAQVWIYPWTHSAQSFVSQAVRTSRLRGVAYDPGQAWIPYGPGNEDRILSIAEEYGIELMPPEVR